MTNTIEKTVLLPDQTEQDILPAHSEAETGGMPDSMTAYLQAISQTPLLTAEEECVLSAQVMAGKAAERRLAEEAPEEQLRLDLQALAESGRQAQNQLVSANLRLVVAIAKGYQGRGLSLQDLIQEGNLGLMRAAGKYDAGTGNRFSTCAMWWIRQAISRAVTDQSRPIRLPGNVYQKVMHLCSCQRKMTVQLGREPTAQELAEELGVSVKKVKEWQQYAMEVTSLDMSVSGENDGARLGDFVPGMEGMEQVDNSITCETLREVLERALDQLGERERLVLELRYGLNGHSIHTLEAVSQMLGLTRERVRQIESRALRLIRTGRESRALAEFIA